MASGPDLFVVCKKCGSEVSPYITECPYCGTRLRKRAPKIERGGVGREPKAPAAPHPPSPEAGRDPRYPRRPAALRDDLDRPGVADRDAGSRAGLWDVSNLLLWSNTTDEYYRTVTTLFFYGHTGYEVVALGAIFLFGWLLERRHGFWAPLLVFLIGGAAGNFLAIAGDDVGLFTAGGNGAALALLAAWAMRDVLGRRRGVEDDSDLLGALAIAAVLILLPLASVEASALAGLGGGITGVILGLLLARLPER